MVERILAPPIPYWISDLPCVCGNLPCPTHVLTIFFGNCLGRGRRRLWCYSPCLYSVKKGRQQSMWLGRTLFSRDRQESEQASDKGPSGTPGGKAGNEGGMEGARGVKSSADRLVDASDLEQATEASSSALDRMNLVLAEEELMLDNPADFASNDFSQLIGLLPEVIG